MTNRKWVAHLWKVVSLHFPYDQQDVSDIALFVKGNLIKSIPITNRKWVTLHILWKALNTSFPMTNREWVALYILWKAVSSNFSHHKQEVSDISYFVKSSLTFFLLTTGSEQHCTFCKRQCHHIFSYDQQLVSDIANFLTCILSIPQFMNVWCTCICIMTSHVQISVCEHVAIFFACLPFTLL